MSSKTVILEDNMLDANGLVIFQSDIPLRVDLKGNIENEDGIKVPLNHIWVDFRVIWMSAEGGEPEKECDWCGEPANELSNPHMFDMAIGKKMCRHCWDHDREVYKGSYGEDIGEFKPITVA